jgi:hypothetical protein
LELKRPEPEAEHSRRSGIERQTFKSGANFNNNNNNNNNHLQVGIAEERKIERMSLEYPPMA